MNLENMKSHKLLWLGRVLMIIPIFIFSMSAFMKLSHSPQMLEGIKVFGIDKSIMTPIGAVEITCLVLYLIPVTSVLGAILLTGYLGGAIMTHLRVGQNFTTPLAVGIIVWASLYLRDKRLHALLPLRKNSA
jgi:hypothetical protein